MPEKTSFANPGHSLAKWTLHWLLLCAAMTAPFILFEPPKGALVAGAIGGLHLLWRVIAAVLRDRGGPRIPAKVALAVAAFESSVPGIVRQSATVEAVDDWIAGRIPGLTPLRCAIPVQH